jgi:hypothetical protein
MPSTQHCADLTNGASAAGPDSILAPLPRPRRSGRSGAIHPVERELHESRLAAAAPPGRIAGMWSGRIRRSSGALVGIVGAVILLLIAAGTATAGTYTIYSCRTPGGTAAGSWSWQARVSSLSSFGDGCPKGAITLNMSTTAAHPSNDYARVNFAAAPDTTIASYFVWRSVQLGATYNYWRYEDVNGTWVVVGSCSGCSLGSTSNVFDQDNLVSDSNLSGVTGLSMLISCGEADTSTTPCPASNPAASLQLYRADITLNDPYPPVLSAPPSGPLLSGQPLSGVQSATLSATDRGGGVYQASATIDDQTVASTVLDANGGLCQQPFTVAQPCKASATGSIAVDTRQLADGVHMLRLSVTDATGTNAASFGPVPIVTANGICNPEPPATSLRLGAWFQQRRLGAKPITIITARYGRPPTVVGSLVDPSGAPIADAPVCVVTANATAGAPLQPAGMVTTNPGGGFSFKLPPGPSRRIYLVHRAADGAIVTTLNVRVPAEISLHESRRTLHNGRVLVLRGRLRHGPMPPGGLLVELQALRAPHRWQTFGTTTTGRGGRFRYRYRFTRTVGLQRYSLRARVAAQSTYPYLAGASRPVTVLVRG